MIWLGDRRGDLSDWVTQRWVQIAGRRLLLKDHLWLDGPIGNTRLIGKDFFLNYARQYNLQVVQTGVRGLVDDLCLLSGGPFNPDRRKKTATLPSYNNLSIYE